MIVPTTGQEDILVLPCVDQWQLGSAKRDNGLLIAITVNDRRIQILTGYGLEGSFPDIVRIALAPTTNHRRMPKGVNAGLTEIEIILNLDPGLQLKRRNNYKNAKEQTIREQEAKSKTFSMALFILICNWLVVVGNV